MITESMLEELLKEDKNKNKKPEYIFHHKKGMVHVYARSFPKYRAMGKTEKEALENLANLYGEVSKSLKMKSELQESNSLEKINENENEYKKASWLSRLGSKFKLDGMFIKYIIDKVTK